MLLGKYYWKYEIWKYLNNCFICD